MTANKLLATVGGAAIALTLATGSAQATFLHGTLFFTGLGNSDYDGQNVLNATNLDFGANGAAVGSIFVTFGTQDFAVLIGSLGSINDIALTPGIGGVATPSAQPVFTIGAAPWTFTSTLLTVDVRQPDPHGDVLKIAGSGILDDGVGGFDPTPGTFALSTSTSPTGGFSFSYAASAANIPEPATLGLLGAGLLAAGAATRRRRKAAR